MLLCPCFSLLIRRGGQICMGLLFIGYVTHVVCPTPQWSYVSLYIHVKVKKKKQQHIHFISFTGLLYTQEKRIVLLMYSTYSLLMAKLLLSIGWFFVGNFSHLPFDVWNQPLSLPSSPASPSLPPWTKNIRRTVYKGRDWSSRSLLLNKSDRESISRNVHSRLTSMIKWRKFSKH